MYQQGRFKMAHIQEINAQILELPYNKKSLSMIILLPDDITDRDNGLKKVETLSCGIIHKCLDPAFHFCLNSIWMKS